MATRQEVYAAVDSERDYQDRRWAGVSPTTQPITSWLVYMQDYMTGALHVVSRSDNPNEALDIVRKVVALGVACMEDLGAPMRGAPLARGARLPEPAPAAAPAVRKDCDTCAHEGSDIHAEPCRAGYVDIAQGWAPRTVCSTCRHDGDEDACAVCCSSEGIRAHWLPKT